MKTHSPFPHGGRPGGSSDLITSTEYSVKSTGSGAQSMDLKMTYSPVNISRSYWLTVRMITFWDTRIALNLSQSNEAFRGSESVPTLMDIVCKLIYPSAYTVRQHSPSAMRKRREDDSLPSLLRCARMLLIRSKYWTYAHKYDDSMEAFTVSARGPLRITGGIISEIHREQNVYSNHSIVGGSDVLQWSV